MTDAGNVARGHKAAISNPNVSEQAKEHSRQVLDELNSSGDTAGSKNLGNVIGGHKAALKNPNVSKEAKEHSQEVLEDIDVA